MDAGLSTMGRWARKPAVIGIAVMVAVALGRRRSLKLVRAGLGLVPAALRLRSAFARR